MANKGRGNHGENLTARDLEILRAFINSFSTRTSAAISLGIDRNVLDRVLLTGRGSKTTIQSIKKALTNEHHYQN